ncbi:unnamed protein product [Closterium sp. Naga37s-1]|nr:unnamed protein product [Closterium sp. Naga37s-1]
MPVSPGGTLAPAAIVRLRSAASTFQKLPLGFLPPGGPGAAVVSAATRFIARFGKRDGPKKVRKPRKATRKVRVVGDGDVEGEDDAEEEAEETEEEATRFSVVGRQVSIVRGQGAAFSLSTSGLGAGLGGGATGAGTGAGAGAGAGGAMANLFVNLHPRLLLACRSKLLDIGTRLFAPSSSPSTPLSIITLRSALPTPAGPSGPRPFRGAAGLRPHGPAGSTHAHGGSGGGYHQHPRGPSSARSGTPRASGTGGLEATLDDEKLGRPGAAAAAEAAAAAVAASARSFAEASVPLAIGALGGDFSRRRPARTVSKFHHGRVGAHSGNHSAAAEAVESPRVKRGGRGGAGDWAKLVSTTIAVLGRHGQVDAARRVFDRARAFGVPPNVYAFSALISAYGRSGRSTDALALLRSMRDAGCLPNLVTYNAAIDACAKAGGAAGAGEAEVARAWALVHEMKELGIAPDRVARAWALVHEMKELCIAPDRVARAWALVHEMKELGIAPDRVARAWALVHEMKELCIAPDRVARAWALVHEMKELGIAPDRVARAWALVHEMKELGIAPDWVRGRVGGWGMGAGMYAGPILGPQITYNSLMAVCSRAGQWQEALRVFELMGQEACAAATNAAAAATAGSADSTASASAPAPAAAAAAAGSRGGRKEQQGQSGRRRGKEGGEEAGAVALVRDIFTFNTLIDALCKASQMDAAAAAFASMAQSDVTPNVVTFSTMIDGYRKGNDLSSAINMFHTMQHAGVRPDRVTYNTLLDIYGKAGRLNEAIAVAREMEAAGWRLDVVAHNALLDAYGKAGRCDEVMRLFHAMKRQGLTPNVLTLSAVVTALSRAGRHQEAAALFQQYRDMGLQVDVVVYSAIIDAHGKQGKVEEAMSVFRQMLHDGVQPNVVTYNSLIDALGRSTQVTASSQPSEARGKGGKRREEVGGAKTHEQNAEDAEAAEEEEEEGRREVRLEAALRMFREMKAAGVRPNVVTFSAMLSTCSRLSNWRDAALLLREMGTTFEAAAVPASTATTTTTTTAATATAAASACGGSASSSEASAGVYVLAEAMLHGCVHADAGEREEDEREKESKQLFAAVAALDSSTSIAFFNALNDLLWRFNQRVQAVRVTRGARRVGVYEGAVWSKAEAQEWVLDLHLMSVGAAMAMLHLWLLDLQQLVLSSHPGSTSAATTSANNAASSSSSSGAGAGAGGGNSSNPLPRLLNVLTGWGRHSKVVGTSVIKAQVEACLSALASPFRSSASNGGRLSASGPAVTRWLIALAERGMGNPLVLHDERGLQGAWV